MLPIPGAAFQHMDWALYFGCMSTLHIRHTPTCTHVGVCARAHLHTVMDTHSQGCARRGRVGGVVLALNMNTSIMSNKQEKRWRGKRRQHKKAPNVVPHTVNIWLFVVTLSLSVQFTQSSQN